MKNVIFLMILFVMAKESAIGQGCSDSGFCTMGAMRPDQAFPRKIALRLNSIEWTQHFGKTQYGDRIHSTFIDANFAASRLTSIQLRLPGYVIVNGKMPKTTGWGDLFLNVTRNVAMRDRYHLNVTLGAKIYTSRANRTSANGASMPMYQQTSNGSNDINIGASIMTRKWLFATGYQRALNRVQNGFNHEAWEGESLYNVVKVYDPSAGLQRGDDLMFRAERNFRWSRLNLYAGILNLWRVTPDRTLNPLNETRAVEGSKGLASNLLIGGGYQLNAHHGVRLVTSFTLKQRDANPDGLARIFVAQIAYRVRF